MAGGRASAQGRAARVSGDAGRGRPVAAHPSGHGLSEAWKPRQRRDQARTPPQHLQQGSTLVPAQR